ncbi:SET domain-containing protein, partial [Punctularia strigosozonata HHB-11173 SS5]|uniref:SET domain-containing protein n=1 Tax=Punctularia strigosozonata (strain HHB-11173) TaxID=741275 RepID=UPI0004417E78
ILVEYVGELIAEATVDSRDDVATHRGRGYVFGMNAEYSVDASYAGNAARFINHAPKSKANCVAQVKLVNGDHRIGIYA